MILIACGLQREAALLAREGVTVVAGGGDAARLAAELDRHAPQADAILSIGFAGGLAPLLEAGEWVVGTVAPSGAERREWSVGAGAARRAPVRIAGEASGSSQQSERNRAWIARIARTLPGAVVGRIHADGRAVASAAEKHERHVSTRAIACDMESHVAAEIAARHDRPFAVARVVLDAAHRSLPHAALVAMRPDGGLAIGAVVWSLGRRPWQLPALIRLAKDAGVARRSLVRGYAALADANFCIG